MRSGVVALVSLTVCGCSFDRSGIPLNEFGTPHDTNKLDVTLDGPPDDAADAALDADADADADAAADAELGVDLPLTEGPPDMPLIPDQPQPDKLVADHYAPDQVVPDQVVPDQALPDMQVCQTWLPKPIHFVPCTIVAPTASLDLGQSGTWVYNTDTGFLTAPDMVTVSTPTSQVINQTNGPQLQLILAAVGRSTRQASLGLARAAVIELGRRVASRGSQSS